MLSVCGQVLVKTMEVVYTLFPLGGVLRYVFNVHVLRGLSFLWLFQWLRLIVENRSHYSENVGNLNDINDIRNGVFANELIHKGFDSRKAVILKVYHTLLPKFNTTSLSLRPPIHILRLMIFPRPPSLATFPMRFHILLATGIHCNG
jgi:hypothetical protein